MIKNENKVVILGCGHGGMALAADLKLRGAKVALWSDPNHANKLRKIAQNNNEIIIEESKQVATVKLDLVSEDLSEVIQFGNVIYNCTPMPAHTVLFHKIAHLVKAAKNIKLFVNFSGVFSGLDQLLKTKYQAIHDHIKIFDTSTFPYACRAGNNNDVTILGKKSELTIAPLFPSDNHYLNLLPDCLKPIKLNIIENSFKLGLMGTNAIFHPATVLFNARLIDNGYTFLFYKEGISQRTALLHEALDGERIMLARAMGYELNRCVEDDNKYYGTNFTSSYDFSRNSTVHKNIKAPTTLNHRFVTEDIAYGLVPLSVLGKLYQLNLSNVDSVINIFSTIMGIDYYRFGRNLHGLTKKFIQELSTFLPQKISA